MAHLDSERTQPVGPQRDGTTSVIVVGVDGGDTSWRALYYAVGVARRQRCSVLAMFVLPHPTGVGGVSDAYAFQAHRDGARDIEAEIARLAADSGVSIEFMCVAGNPTLCLTDAVDARRADALVLGAGRRRRNSFVQSGADRAARRSLCPVTIVP